jgi:hypothetical protein
LPDSTSGRSERNGGRIGSLVGDAAYRDAAVAALEALGGEAKAPFGRNREGKALLPGPAALRRLGYNVPDLKSMASDSPTVKARAIEGSVSSGE